MSTASARLCLVALLLTGTTCSFAEFRESNPLFGGGGLSVERERELCAEIAAQIRSQAELVSDPVVLAYVNEIANFVSTITGHPLFDPSIYYFHKIPTIVNPVTVAWIVAGAVSIALLASILPARRAARLHPVEALRYE